MIHGIIVFTIYLQSECKERYQVKPCSKYDRQQGFDVIFGKVVPCRTLRWISCKHSNNVARQVETQGKSTFFVAYTGLRLVALCKNFDND